MSYNIRDVVPWSLIYGELNMKYENKLKKQKNSTYIMARNFMKDIIRGNTKYECLYGDVLVVVYETLTIEDIDDIAKEYIDSFNYTSSGVSIIALDGYKTLVIERAEREKRLLQKHEPI